ncbi:Hypothetical predicted protein, partial [Cloeon dipterum]
ESKNNYPHKSYFFGASRDWICEVAATARRSAKQQRTTRRGAAREARGSNKMSPLFAASFLLGLCLASAIDFTTVHEWDEFDYIWPSQSGADTSNEEMKTNFNPLELDLRYMAVFGERLFLSLIVHSGTPASLVWMPKSGSSTAPPKLAPFPSWDLHKNDNCNTIQNARGMEPDTDGRLWVVDDGNRNCQAKLWIFDLANNDKTERIHQFPNTFVHHSYGARKLVDIAVDKTPEDSLAYITENYSEHIIVYSLKMDKSWTVNTPGTRWYSLALSPIREARQLYLGRSYTDELYSISVSELKNEGGNATVNLIGKWKEKLYALLIDSNNVLYAAMIKQNYLSKWNISEPFRRQRFHGVRTLNTYLPFTFAMDTTNTLWLTERNQSGGANRYKLLKAAVGTIFSTSTASTTPQVTVSEGTSDAMGSRIGEKVEPGKTVHIDMAVFRQRIFVCFYSESGDVPLTLAWLPTDARSNSPKLNPFPSREFQVKGNCSTMQSVKIVRVDSVGRLWAVDMGSEKCAAKLWVFDLTNDDSVVLIYQFPNETSARGKDQKPRLKDLVLDEEQKIDCIAYIAEYYSKRMDHLYFSSWNSSNLYCLPVSAIRNRSTESATPSLYAKKKVGAFKMLTDSKDTLYFGARKGEIVQKWNTNRPFQEELIYEGDPNERLLTFSIDMHDNLLLLTKNGDSTIQLKLLNNATGSKSSGNFYFLDCNNNSWINLSLALIILILICIILWLALWVKRLLLPIGFYIKMDARLGLTQTRLINLTRRNKSLAELVTRKVADTFDLYIDQKDQKLSNLPSTLKQKLLRIHTEKWKLHLSTSARQMEIFRQLICKEIEEISINGQLMSGFLSPQSFLYYFAMILRCAAKHAPNVKSLSFNILTSLRAEMMEDIGQLKMLVNLDISECVIFIVHLMEICRNLPSLKFVKAIKVVFVNSQDFDDARDLFESFSHLIVLLFDCLYSTMEEKVKRFWKLCIKHLPNLQAVGKCGTDPNSFLELTEEDLPQEPSQLRKLSTKPSSLLDLHLKFPNMRVLRVLYPEGQVYNDSEVSPLLKFTKIESLELYNVPSIQFVERFVGAYGPRLQRCEIRNPANRHVALELKRIFNSCPELEILILENVAISNCLTPVTFFSKLREFHWLYTDTAEICLSNILRAPLLEKFTLHLPGGRIEADELQKLSRMISDGKILRNLDSFAVSVNSQEMSVDFFHALSSFVKNASAHLPILSKVTCEYWMTQLQFYVMLANDGSPHIVQRLCQNFGDADLLEFFRAYNFEVAVGHSCMYQVPHVSLKMEGTIELEQIRIF